MPEKANLRLRSLRRNEEDCTQGEDGIVLWMKNPFTAGSYRYLVDVVYGLLTWFDATSIPLFDIQNVFTDASYCMSDGCWII